MVPNVGMIPCIRMKGEDSECRNKGEQQALQVASSRKTRKGNSKGEKGKIR